MTITLSDALRTSPRKRWALKLQRTDGQVYAFTAGDVDATIGGITYTAGQGLAVSDLALSCDLSVDNLEITTLDDGSLFTAADIIGRRWANAQWWIGWYDWEHPDWGLVTVTGGTLGEITRNDASLTIELRGLKQYLNTEVGLVSSKACRARVCDYPVQVPDARCGLNPASYWVNGTVTAVASRRVFTASALTQADDWFGNGAVEWLTGGNAGLSAKVITFSGGAFTLLTGAVAAIAVGDTFRALVGCRGRLDEDCATKFNNARRFQGDPHRPTQDQLTASVTPDV